MNSNCSLPASFRFIMTCLATLMFASASAQAGQVQFTGQVGGQTVQEAPFVGVITSFADQAVVPAVIASNDLNNGQARVRVMDQSGDSVPSTLFNGYGRNGTPMVMFDLQDRSEQDIVVCVDELKYAGKSSCLRYRVMRLQ